MKAIIYGASGQGRVTLDVLRESGGKDVVGFLDDDTSRHGSKFEGLPILGGKDFVSELRTQGIEGVYLGIGDGQVRAKLASLCQSHDLVVLGFKHPSAIVSPNAQLDESAMLWPRVVVNSHASIEANVILNTGAIVEHDVQVGAYAHLAPGCIVCGQVTIGSETWIGAGAVVRQELNIGKQTMIGAGSMVTKDIPDGVVAYGVPCKVQN